MNVDLLRPHQHEPATWLLDILSKHQSAADFSDCGVGKTYVSAYVASTLKMPTLVICPKIICSAWHKAFEHFNDLVSVIGYEKLRTGRTPFGKWVGRIPKQAINKCQSCQCVVNELAPTPCYAHPLGIHCLAPAKTRGRKGRFEFSPEIKLIIGDEAHRFSGLDSENAEMLVGARRQDIKILLLTATPATSPLGLRAIGYALDLHGLHDYYQWAARNGCRKIPPLPGIRWAVGAERQIEIMKEIRNQIIPARGIRVRVADIPNFPERTINPELYDIEENKQIDELYKTMAAPLQQLAKTMESDKAPEHPLTKILRARQKIELLKVPVVEELASDYRAKGHSVAIFVNFEQTRRELMTRLKIHCSIHGGQDNKSRDAAIELFQNNSERVIVVNNEAGGVGLSLHDTHGGHLRIGLVMPNFSAVSMRQIFGRLHRDGGKSPCAYRVIFAARTVEEKVWKAVSAKMRNLDALNDSDLTPEP